MSKLGKYGRKAVNVATNSGIEALVLGTIAVNLASVVVPQAKLARLLASPAGVNAFRALFVGLVIANWRGSRYVEIVPEEEDEKVAEAEDQSASDDVAEAA